MVATGCVPALDTTEAPCPCASGYHCCPLEARCLPSGETCPLSRNCPLPPTATGVFELGSTDIHTAAPNFVPLDGAGTLLLEHGPQGGGGYHLWMQLQILGINPAPGITLHRALFDPVNPSRALSSALRFQVDQPSLYCDNDQRFLLLDPPRLYVCPPLKPGQAMFDRDLALRVEVTDRDGRMVSVEHTVHPLCPATDTNCRTSSMFGCAAP